ncbi:MAG: hypothetical protein IK058_01890 [Bacteroidales bacterium]|nr:hypothetical protein [Bacteroidales bacterium]
METKKPYIPPQLTTVTFKTERGYALSVETVSFWNDVYDAEQMESYEIGNGWSSGNSTFWN